ncbi:MAG: hypothetical protein IH984_08275 [Planctomycetes bacterium]|nr:hypothetical protein [Planctomycetota bacterium]
MNADVVIEQALFGYSDGHRLLDSSFDLPRADERLLSILSDFSGHAFLPGFEEYYSGFALAESEMYALCKTWYAIEMERPGCVWTHVILVKLDQWERIDDVRILRRAFNRPSQDLISKQAYSKRLNIAPDCITGATDDLQNVVSPLSLHLVRALYQSEESICVEAQSAKELEELVFGLWNMQWNALRHQFSFCTGALEARDIPGFQFNLEIVPYGAPTRKGKLQIERHSRAEFVEYNNQWAEVIVKGALHPQLSTFGDFVRSACADFPAKRSMFPFIAQVYALLEKVEYENADPADVLDSIAERFPSPNDAVALKGYVLGNGTQSRVAFDTVAVLRYLASSPHFNSFQNLNLRLSDRIDNLWSTRKSGALDLLVWLDQEERNIVGEELFGDLVKHLSAHDMVMVIDANPNLRYALLRACPGIAEEPALWCASRSVQLEMLDMIAEATIDAKTLIQVVNTIIESTELYCSDILDRLGSRAVDAILTLAASSESHVINHDCLLALSRESEAVMRWLRSESSVNNHAWFLATKVLDPTQKSVQKLGLGRWLDVGRQSMSGVADERNLNDVMAFVLTIGFESTEDMAAELVSTSFDAVHEALAHNRLPYESWQKLHVILPRLRSASWDKCERLRRKIVHTFLDNQWDVKHFLLATARPSTFQLVMKTCKKLRKDGKLMTSHLVSAIERNPDIGTPDQKRLLF